MECVGCMQQWALVGCWCLFLDGSARVFWTQVHQRKLFWILQASCNIYVRVKMLETRAITGEWRPSVTRIRRRVQGSLRSSCKVVPRKIKEEQEHKKDSREANPPHSIPDSIRPRRRCELVRMHVQSKETPHLCQNTPVIRNHLVSMEEFAPCTSLIPPISHA